jgi:predicted membrane protein
MGAAPAGLFIYVIPFLISTVAGSILAYVLIRLFQKSGIFSMIQSGN